MARLSGPTAGESAQGKRALSLQTDKLAAACFGIDAHPTLRAGNHVHWRFAPSLGFPDFGFDLFRRTHRAGTPRALDMAGLALGNLSASTKIGATTWTGHDVYRPNRIVSAQTQSGSQSVLAPSTLAT